MVVECDTHHPPAPWASSCLINSGDKIRYLIRTICCRGLATSTLSSWGKPNFASSWSFFSVLAGLAPLAPSHRTALCSSGGRGACAAASVLVLPSLPSCGGAFWQGDKVSQFSYRISIVRYHYKMYTRAFSCKDTFSFSLRSPSLSISSSSLDPCILY